jgi:hypothetical protein
VKKSDPITSSDCTPKKSRPSRTVVWVSGASDEGKISERKTPGTPQVTHLKKPSRTSAGNRDVSARHRAKKISTIFLGAKTEGIEIPTYGCEQALAVARALTQNDTQHSPRVGKNLAKYGL